MDYLLESKRIVWIDALRGLGILLVVLGHADPPFIKIIYGFHMPIFFMISGMIWKEKTVRYYLRSYVVPYFVLCSINLFIYSGLLLAMQKEVPIVRYVIGILYSRGTTEWMPNCSPLWFLTVLFCALVIFDYIQIVKTKSGRIILIIVAGVTSSLLAFFEVVKLPWNVDTSLMGVVFIYSGYNLMQTNWLDNIKELSTIFQIIILTMIGVVGYLCIVFNPIDVVNFDNNRYGNVCLMLIGAVSICFVLINLCYRILRKGVIAEILSWFGQHTLFIMGFDYFDGTITKILLGKIGFENWISVFCMKIILLIIGCLLWNRLVDMIKNESIRKALSY